jgi:hypothetical protein
MRTSNIYWGKGRRCVGLTTLPHTCADFLEIWEPLSSEILKACTGIAMPYHFRTNVIYEYEGVSKIFRTGAAIYTAVVVARNTGRW